MILLSVDISAPLKKIWDAITDINQTAEWYFKFSNDYILEKGRKFDWTAGEPKGKQWLHRGEMIEIIPESLLSHTWEYPGYSGTSRITWKLTPIDTINTHLDFKHEFIVPFDENVKELHISNFESGWDKIINNNLVNHLSKVS